MSGITPLLGPGIGFAPDSTRGDHRKMGDHYVPRKDTPWEGIPFILSGTCLCGHGYEDHHDSGIAKAMGGCPAECEYYGSNELGGMMPIDSPGEGTKWVRHCGVYVDMNDPDPERRRGG